MSDIKMDRIYTIESQNDPEAWNKGEDARGLGQIRAGVLKDWNAWHPNQQYNADDLFKAEVNQQVSNWYMNVEIPRLLKHFKLSDTPENRIISYNAGIDTLVSEKEVPDITKNYILKYMMGGDVKKGQKRLKGLGFDPGSIDGIVGPNTRAAWEKFQASDVTAGPDNVNFGIHNLKEK